MTGEDRPTGLVADPRYRAHLTSRGHPECPERFTAALEGVRESVAAEQILDTPAREATFAELALCHTAEYIKTTFRHLETGRYNRSTGETDSCRDS